MRTLRDGEGRSWNVWHVVPQSQVLRSSSMPDLTRGWLCFEHNGEKRRFAEPPDDWAALDDRRLLELLGRASSVRKAGV